jgi:hypothetical protein
MEYVDGETLAAIIRRRGALPAAEAVRTLREIASVAAHFHAQGVVHRDLKSNNVKINSAGRVKILDFGIARQEQSNRMTQVGAVIGTPEALAPEQVRGAPATQASDVWQLGVMFYEMLAGRLPFQAASEQEMYARILAAEYPPVTRWQPGVPASLEKIVARCLQKDAGRRYASAAELHEALSEWEGNEGRAARGAKPGALARSVAAGRRLTTAWVLGGATAAMALIAIGMAITGGNRDRGPLPPAPPGSISRETLPRATTPVEMKSTPVEMKTVTVDTMDGVARVFRDGQLVGTTPYRIEAPPGEKIILLLRRVGFKDLPLEFETTERHNYTYTMEPVRER